MQKVSTFRVRGKVSAPFIWMQFDLSSEGKPEKKCCNGRKKQKQYFMHTVAKQFFFGLKSELFSYNVCRGVRGS